MNPLVEESLGMRISQLEQFFSSRGYLSAIPKDFIPKSVMYGDVKINPSSKMKDLVACLKDYTPVYYSSGAENNFYVAVYSVSGKGYFNADIGRSRVGIHFYSSDTKANEYIKEILEKFNDFKISNTIRGGVWASFSYMIGTDVNRFSEFLKCPTWNAINKNYPESVKEKLEILFKTRSPWEKGRLVILSGPAGTGKTFFIRSLMMAWRNKFDFCVVTDPERFASDPSYYYDIGNSRRNADFEDDEGFGTRILSRIKKKKIARSLIILEDSADLILTESRQNHFDKIGKLLNMTDGLLGQSREDIFLITFNEDVKEIDPAFLRPGRCLLNAEFREFEEDEAKAWLDSHKKGEVEVSEKMTLAQMYAALYAKKNVDNTPEEARLGFHS